MNWIHQAKIAIIGLALALAAAGPIQAGPESSDRLTGKMSEITRMNAEIRAHHNQARDLRRQMVGIMEALSQEIHRKRTEREIVIFEEGRRIPRIKYNLDLIGRLRAAIVLIDRKIDYLQQGLDRLDFLSRHVQDDVMLLKAVSHVTVDALIGEIDRALTEYRSAANESLIDTRRLVPESPDKIWHLLSAAQ